MLLVASEKHRKNGDVAGKPAGDPGGLGFRGILNWTLGEQTYDEFHVFFFLARNTFRENDDFVMIASFSYIHPHKMVESGLFGTMFYLFFGASLVHTSV